MKHLSTILLCLAIGFAVACADASEFTGAVGNDWSDADNWTGGVPSGTIGAEIGTAANPDVSAVISGSTVFAVGVQVGIDGNGSLEVAAGGSLNVVINRMNIGVSGGTAVTANVAFNADTRIYGGIYNAAENEIHSLDIGGGAKANVTIAPGVSVIATSAIGIGKDDRWAGGYETHVSMGENSLLQSGAVGGEWVTFGLGGEDHQMVLSMQNNATIEGTLYQLGGTLEINGTANLNGGSRWRSYGMNPVIKLIGEGAQILTYGFKFGVMDRSEGPRVDVSELVVPRYTWVTVMTDQDGGFWGSNSMDIDFVPGTDSRWEMQLIKGAPLTAEPHYVQVMYVPGSISGDDRWDDDDLSILLANWGTGTTWDEGDLNLSGDVGDDDLSLLLASWGDGIPPAPQAVPEPMTLGLLAVGGICALLRKMR